MRIPHNKKYTDEHLAELVSNFSSLFEFKNQHPKEYKAIRSRRLYSKFLGHLNRMRNPVKIGEIFGKLTVLEKTVVKKGRQLYICQCECGNKKAIRGSDLRSKRTRSCGCIQVEITKLRVRLGPGTSTWNWLFYRYNKGALSRSRVLPVLLPTKGVL